MTEIDLGEKLTLHHPLGSEHGIPFEVIDTRCPEDGDVYLGVDGDAWYCVGSVAEERPILEEVDLEDD